MISRKDELTDKLKKKDEMNELQQGLNPNTPNQYSSQNLGYTMGGELDAEKKLAALPANLQVQVGKLPNKAKNALMGMR